MIMFLDNKYVIDLASNYILYGRSKYIEAKFHFYREQVNKEVLFLDT